MRLAIYASTLSLCELLLCSRSAFTGAGFANPIATFSAKLVNSLPRIHRRNLSGGETGKPALLRAALVCGVCFASLSGVVIYLPLQLQFLASSRPSWTLTISYCTASLTPTACSSCSRALSGNIYRHSLMQAVVAMKMHPADMATTATLVAPCAGAFSSTRRK